MGCHGARPPYVKKKFGAMSNPSAAVRHGDTHPLGALFQKEENEKCV
jgi:hypothetical protein